MKVGTVPKITAGAVAVIVLAFIGTRQFISSKEDSSSSVEVVTSSTETANSPAQTDATLKGVVTAPALEDKPQISKEEMEQIEDFFAQLEDTDVQSETDTSQLPTDAASDRDSDSDNVTDSSVASEDAGLSAEEVMNAYVEAFRNVDFEATLPFVTGTMRESIEFGLRTFGGEIPEEFVIETLNAIEDNMPEGVPEALLEETREFVIQSIQKGLDAIQTPEGQAKMREGYSQIEIVSSEHVGDEFHFRLEAPTSDDPANTGLILKMRKVGGEWRIYDREGIMIP